MKKIVKEKNKYLYISGAVTFILILVIGYWSSYSYLLAGLWFGFWAGVNLTIEYFEENHENKNRLV